MTDLKVACGGVIIDTDGRILLREPSGHFDGYVWIFSKGRPERVETPEEAALREAQEETGVAAEVVERIPGTFSGGTAENIYFLMRPTGQAEKPDKETATVRWATPDEARALISKTTKCPSAVSAISRCSKRRSHSIRVHEARLIKARADQQRPSVRAKLRRRAVIERKIDHLHDLGARKARYRGRRKTKLQAFLAATVANFSRLDALAAFGLKEVAVAA
jgi:ADP-ribose pyrophosphatase YjhB (NUDIX family)